MMTAVFAGMAGVLLVAAVYWWARGRGNGRSTGTWAMCSLLVSFAAAFASYAPAIRASLESVVPHVARLLSNSSALAAATSVLVFMYQLNLEPDEARRRTVKRVFALGAAVAAMVTLFIMGEATHRTPFLYGGYVLIYISFLAVTAKDFLRQTWRQAKRSRRTSQRIGLRITAVGCLFALLYAAYKLVTAIGIGLGILSGDERPPCSSLVTPVHCAFSVTAPAISVLLITVGLTLPAITWPASEFLRRRWERKSHEALGPLWKDLASAVPEVVLQSSDVDEDPDFLLHRRVIENQRRRACALFLPLPTCPGGSSSGAQL